MGMKGRNLKGKNIKQQDIKCWLQSTFKYLAIDFVSLLLLLRG